MANQVTLNGHLIILHYPGGSSGITMVLKSGRGWQKRDTRDMAAKKDQFKVAGLKDVKNGATSLGMEAPLDTENGCKTLSRFSRSTAMLTPLF